VSEKQAVKSISLLWLGSILGAGCVFLTQALLARELGPIPFGGFSAALAMITLVAPLASFGVHGFWLKAFGAEGWEAIRWLKNSLKYILLTTTLVFVCLFLWAEFGPHDKNTRDLLLILSIYLLGQVAMELVGSKLQLEERYFALALWQFSPHLLRFFLVAGLALALTQGMTLVNVSYLYAIISIGVFGVGVLFMWRMYRGQLALKGHGEQNNSVGQLVTLPSMKQVATQSWTFGLAGVFHLIYFQSDIILLKYISGDEAAGIYNVAFVVMVAVYMLPSVIYQKYLLPKIHRWANHERKKFYQVYRSGNKFMLMLGLLSMGAIWLLSPWGVTLLFGDNYKEALIPLSILALAAPIRFVATNVGSVLVTQEYMQIKVYYMGGVALINVVLNLFLIPNYGVIGAAIATVLSELSLLLIYFWGASRLVFIKEARSNFDI